MSGWPTFTFRGTDSHGVAHTGALPGDHVAFVERRYNNGWRTLEVELDGEAVGWIGLSDGLRIWSAEQRDAS